MAILSKELSSKEMVPVCRQIATAYEAGIPIIDVLEKVGEQQKNSSVRRVLTTISDDLRHGDTLAEATNKQSESLSPLFVNLLANGEQSGKLDNMLNELADYYEDRLAMRRQVASALAYPMLLLVICWFLGSFSLGMVDVALDGLNGRGGGVSGIKEYFAQYVSFQIRAMIIFGLVAAIGVVLSRMGALGWIVGMVTTFVWPLSVVTRKLSLARFFRSFSLMLSGGIGMVQCIQQSVRVVSNPYIAKDLMQAIPHVRRGSTLVEAFQNSRMLTPLSREMLSIGEQSGKLEYQLGKAAEYHMNEAQHAIKQAVTVFTTLIMLAVFTLIGGVVIYFYSSLYGGIADGLGI